MQVRVLFFGPARDLTGVDTATFEVPGGTRLADLRRAVSDRFGDLGPVLPSVRFAVNESFVSDTSELQDGDEIAAIPPVSGGSGDAPGTWVELAHGPIAVDRVRAFVTGDPALGGLVTFEGATRDEPDPRHGALVHLDYEAYEAMALRQLERLAAEARRQWGAGRVAILHRLGPVPPGQASVVISVACGHRAEAFDACRWLIDMLKRDVPIWKKDVFADGHVRWTEVAPSGGPASNVD